MKIKKILAAASIIIALAGGLGYLYLTQAPVPPVVTEPAPPPETQPPAPTPQPSPDFPPAPAEQQDLERRYTRIMNHVFRHEGGWSNHPNDPGGATMYGITIHDVRRYINPRAQPADVRRITRAQARKIYRERYWNAIRGDELGAGLDQTLMDLAVNSGVGRARQFARRAMGLNGVMVPFTDREIAMLREHCAPDRCVALIQNINGQRRRFVRALQIYRHFGTGWERRISFVLNDSLAMARGVTGGMVASTSLTRTYGRAIYGTEDLEQ